MAVEYSHTATAVEFAASAAEAASAATEMAATAPPLPPPPAPFPPRKLLVECAHAGGVVQDPAVGECRQFLRPAPH